MTAPEYLRFCGEISGMAKSEIPERSAELLDLVGLSGEKHRIQGYSRGMKQRLGIAQALLNRPRLLICDEPTSALDAASVNLVTGYIKELSTRGKSVISVTHDNVFAAACDKVIEIKSK